LLDQALSLVLSLNDLFAALRGGFFIAFPSARIEKEFTHRGFHGTPQYFCLVLIAGFLDR